MDAFWDWVSDNAWSVWFALAIILGIVETTTLDLVFIMLAVGAASGGVASLLGLGVVPAALVAVLVSVAMLGVVRPVAKRHLKVPSALRTGTDALVGRRGLVTERIDATHGLIKLEGDVWTARPFDGVTAIDPGREVDVVEIRGATALVFEADQ
jgi:membrane protein implicated in regulation of membrane protease activity